MVKGEYEMNREYKILLLESLLFVAIGIVMIFLTKTQEIDHVEDASLPYMILFLILTVVLIMYIKKEEPVK
jgi:hypothetical protein